MPHLETPPHPGDHSLGRADAPATLVEYADFQCPDCLIAERVVEKLLRSFGGSLRFIFRHFPHASHPMAVPAAQAAEFATEEDRFWPMHHALFAHARELSPELLFELAGRLELDASAMAEAIEKGRFRKRIESDREGGERSGVRGTPTFFLNSELYEGPSNYEGLAEAVRQAIER